MRLAVTGAFGYSGQYIAKRLLGEGHDVITLTNSTNRPNPFGSKVQAFRFNFGAPRKLEETLRGVDVLINTYWVRFDHATFTHSEAVENTKVLFGAARRAGVKRVVHVSITNPDINSDLPYFRGKAELEETLVSSGMSYCILRPTVLFGKEDVLINNIAWALRKLPFFGVFGSGDYRLQPIFVDDLAAVAAERAAGLKNEVVNAIGPETFTFRELVEMIARAIGVSRRILSVPPWAGYLASRFLGWVVKDVVITREEIQGLMENRLYVEDAPLGKTKLSDWVVANRESLGLRYTSELARRRDRFLSYRSN